MIATMLRGSTNVSRWLFLAGLLCSAACQSVPSSFENKTDTNDSKPRVFSPRMDYDEWTPLGRGDPLKNNPTFDYVPPVLDRVQYWLDSHTTEASAKRDVLVLGVTAKKTSPKIPEQFLKFDDGPKFIRSSQDNAYRNDFTGSTGAEPPKLLRTTNFRNGVVDYRNQNRIQSVPASYYPSPYYNQKTKPYTMMLPPPIVQKQMEPSTAFSGILSKDKINGYGEPSQQLSTQTEEGPVLQDPQYYGIPSKSYSQHHSPSLQASRPQYLQTPSKLPLKSVGISQVETIKNVYAPLSSNKPRYDVTTAPSVSFEKSNLIYQSTQTISGGWLANNGPTSTLPEVNQVTWQTPDYSRDHYDTDHHAAASSNHEVVVGQNANIIVDGDNNDNEEVVVGEKGIASFDASSSSSSVISSEAMPTNLTFISETKTDERKEEPSEDVPTSPKMHIVVANSPSSVELEAQNKTPVAVITPTNYMNKPNMTVSLTTEPPTTSINISENLTSEMEKNQQTSKPQPQKNTMTSTLMFMDDPSTPSSTPNRMMPHQVHQLPHQSPSLSMTPSRHIGNSPHMFGPVQTLSSMHSQPRPNHGMMQLIGSMQPNVGFRPPPPMTMSHIASHMSHMHAPPMKNMMGPGSNVDQTHSRPPQIQSGFSAGFSASSFTSLPAPSTLTVQSVGTEDETVNRYQSAAASQITTTSTSSVPFMHELSPGINAKDSVQEESNHSPLSMLFAEEENSKKKSTMTSQSTPAVPPETTTVPSLTTDPIFSHYKQPAKPIRGPMYLIIQGHSKVKTYKPTVNKHGVPVNNEIVENLTERPLSKFEQLIIENTKNGKVDKSAEEKKKLEEKVRAEKRASTSQESLMSLVESGLGSFTVPPSSFVTETEHQGNSVTTVEVNGN